jgi:TPR repeat protein
MRAGVIVLAASLAFAGFGQAEIGGGEQSAFHGGAWSALPESRADAFIAYRAGKFVTALRLLLPFARAGDVEAASKVGLILGELGRMGVGRESVRQDASAAAEWFKRAAERGEPVASGEYARMREHGEGVPRDLLLAFHFYNEAAKTYPPGPDQLRASADAARVRINIDQLIAGAPPEGPKAKSLPKPGRRAEPAEGGLPAANVTGATRPKPHE